MRAQKFLNSEMRNALGGKATVLVGNELRNPKLTRIQPLKPTLKFGQVCFLYRVSDLESGDAGIEVNGSRVIAVVE